VKSEHTHTANHGHTPRVAGSHLLWCPGSDWGLGALLSCGYWRFKTPLIHSPTYILGYKSDSLTMATTAPNNSGPYNKCATFQVLWSNTVAFCEEEVTILNIHCISCLIAGVTIQKKKKKKSPAAGNRGNTRDHPPVCQASWLAMTKQRSADTVSP